MEPTHLQSELCFAWTTNFILHILSNVACNVQCTPVYILSGVDVLPQHSIQRRSGRKFASIGGSQMLECKMNYPELPYTDQIVTWKKQGIEVPIYIQFRGYPPHIDSRYQGRLHFMGQDANIELSDIRTMDEGWYECTTMPVDDENETNGTWIYLSVNCEYLFESWQEGLESCFALDKSILLPYQSKVIGCGFIIERWLQALVLSMIGRLAV